ncbi:hypothetical protein QPM17_15150 [Marinobacter sp. TBZ242]|uniref:Uncharacterized protein n=1 Tax=Marinobacter azerbaijanicus TaxID=3050455 RepID=A0ABT7IFM8_9GAMM|nr:hypothetical protein [Marinobacter sp. TBZ242]MDL0432480.1 hypothetical protein [Marinobacter sp. TBZ242]
MTPGIWRGIAVSGCLGLLMAAPSMAVAEDDLGVTMRMVTDDADLTESVVREIELREPVALERREGKVRKPAGNGSAREAREAGREAARAAAERAREVRERNEERGRPEKPERPDVSQRPERPELP